MMVVPFQGPDVIVVEDNCPLLLFLLVCYSQITLYVNQEWYSLHCYRERVNASNNSTKQVTLNNYSNIKILFFLIITSNSCFNS